MLLSQSALVYLTFMLCSSLQILFLLLLPTTMLISSSCALRFPSQLDFGHSYNYAYRVEDMAEGLHYQAKQSSDGRVVQGEYSVRLPGGRRDRALKR